LGRLGAATAVIQFNTVYLQQKAPHVSFDAAARSVNALF
jgi:hypothetical protein